MIGQRAITIWIYLVVVSVIFIDLASSSFITNNSLRGQAKMSKTLLPYIKQLNSEYRVILASGSPRRRELLSLIGVQHEVLVSSFAENLDKSRYENPQEYCRHTAEGKVFDVAKTLNGLEKKTLVIGADTIVAIDGHVLEKPADASDAYRMISSLSGRQHEVHTAVVLFSNFHDPAHALTKSMTKIDSFVVTSKVSFASLSEADIAAYVATGEGNDKAGSYGIQGLGGQMVEGIQGCYFNVMGLPIQALSARIASLLDETARL